MSLILTLYLCQNEKLTVAMQKTHWAGLTLQWKSDVSLKGQGRCERWGDKKGADELGLSVSGPPNWPNFPLSYEWWLLRLLNFPVISGCMACKLLSVSTGSRCAFSVRRFSQILAHWDTGSTEVSSELSGQIRTAPWGWMFNQLLANQVWKIKHDGVLLITSLPE